MPAGKAMTAQAGGGRVRIAKHKGVKRRKAKSGNAPKATTTKKKSERKSALPAHPTVAEAIRAGSENAVGVVTPFLERGVAARALTNWTVTSAAAASIEEAAQTPPPPRVARCATPRPDSSGGLANFSGSLK
jgi:hypothetical protein